MQEDLLRQLEGAWEFSDRLFGRLEPSAMAQQPIPLRQPFVFYVGHLPAFAWNQVARGVLDQPSFNPAFDRLFERGIDPLDVDQHAGQAAWPEMAEILAYRDAVRAAIREALEVTDVQRSSDSLLANGRIFRVVLEHEQMHHETLLYMVQELAAPHKRADDAPAPAPAARAERSVVTIPAGRARLGARWDEIPFGWDNEFEACEVEVPAFRIDALPVRNAEFCEFVEAGGYGEPRWWSEDGWNWKERFRLARPHGWIEQDGSGLRVRTAFADVPFEDAASWPAMVSWAEADAYAHWRGARLPSEAEFHRAAYGTPSGGERRQPWGDDDPAPSRGNFAFHSWRPAPAGAHPAGASAWGVHELVGNGWEWTSTRFAPLPGFRPYVRTYPGYSRDFFDGRHFVMRGASWATHAGLIRRSFRNWFQPHYPYVFSKFRCCYPS
ncbi:MAG: SUMF1/EgtB/PvdO family nonheme iron enzyme [Acidobacteria bacterium]|nr:SUMF1/EgtB/PvdO family nonheme iron enzyme [Acidobacteriota bacterium]